MRAVLALLSLTACSASFALDGPTKWDGLRSTSGIKLGLELANSTCPNPQAVCPDGYFCVENVFCLKGDPSEYSAVALVSAGCAAEIVRVESNLDCLLDIKGAIDDLVTAFVRWESKEYNESFAALKTGVADIEKTLQACLHVSWWSTIKKVVTSVLTVFFPELLAPFEIIVHGVNIFNDFKGMMTNCADSVADYITCGKNFGDLIMEIFNVIKSEGLTVGLPEQPSASLLPGLDTGSCNNTKDWPIIQKDMSTFHDTLKGCAKASMGDAAQTSTCLAAKTGLSAACSTCFGTDVHCSAQHCMSKCIINDRSPDCLACSKQFCQPDLVTCSGISAGNLPP